MKKNSKYVILFAFVATIIVSSGTYVILNPVPPDRFFAVWLLGSNGLAESYYPRGNPNIGIGEDVNWTLGVYNHTPTLEYVILKVKLINATTSSPNETTGAPTPVSPLSDFTRILLPNETWSIPFEWTIMNTTRTNSVVTITRLSINHNTVTGDLAEATSGYNFRFVFELWFFDENTNQVSFSWMSGNIQESAWTQIWFNATLSRY